MYSKTHKEPSKDFLGDNPYPALTHCLADAISTIDQIPDFGDDVSIGIFSDFSGTLPSSNGKYNSYSFLIAALGGKFQSFNKKMSELRFRHGILESRSEFSIKRIDSGARFRALPEYLAVADKFIHGWIVTVLIPKNLDSVIGSSRKEVCNHLKDDFARLDLGEWGRNDLEHFMRVLHMVATILSAVIDDKKKVVWHCDSDLVNQDGAGRSHEQIVKFYYSIFGLYPNLKDVSFQFTIAKDLNHPATDLLSLADFSAGMVRETMTANFHGNGVIDASGDTEQAKILLLKWLASKSNFLTKTVIEIVELGKSTLGSRVLKINPADPSQETANSKPCQNGLACDTGL